MNQFDQLASKESIDKTIEALKNNGINAEFEQSGDEAKKRVLDILPEGAEVMTMSSTTLDTTGLSAEINKPDGKFKPVRDKLYAMDKATQMQEMNRMGAALEYAVGSVHAITEDGKVVVASNTGSQLPAYAYAALHVIWVVGVQKIVSNLDAAMKRIYEYVLPLESDRVNKAYNISTGSNVSKILIINKEINPQRITIIFVNEKLGF